jgi:hypothetical protein
MVVIMNEPGAPRDLCRKRFLVQMKLRLMCPTWRGLREVNRYSKTAKPDDARQCMLDATRGQDRGQEKEFHHEEASLDSSKECNAPMTTRCNAISTLGKKCHTVKALNIYNPQKQILYLSQC